MKRSRTWLSMLLGLVLLVQGVAVSAAPHASVGEPDQAANQTAMAMSADLPCHEQADSADMGDRSCCDADCADMTSCALGHLALTTAFQLTTSVSPTERSRLTPVRLPSRTPVSLLRPPITSHG